MGQIKKLPQYLINRLKAGEIVERPASVVKELIENSLDAGATDISIDIEQGGKKLIKITDNGSGISREDLLLTIERYATSKIFDEQDLLHIDSYGFRGEALATIAEVSGFRIQSRDASLMRPQTNQPTRPQSNQPIQTNQPMQTNQPIQTNQPMQTNQPTQTNQPIQTNQPMQTNQPTDASSTGGIGHELVRSAEKFVVHNIPFAGEHGTSVYVTDIFHAVPAREKFLKSDTTERGYIKKLVIQYMIMHRDKRWLLSHNGKHILSCQPAGSLLERVIFLTKDDWEQKLKFLEFQDTQLHMYGLVGDASLHFPAGDWLHIFVNGRPVEDRLLKRAVMDAYQRQIVPGTYPFALVCIEIDPELVDVNVHPRKSQVKFLDPGSIFTRVKGSIQGLIGDKQVNYAAFTKSEVRDAYAPSGSFGYTKQYTGVTGSQMAGFHSLHTDAAYGQGYQQGLGLHHNSLVSGTNIGEQTAVLELEQEPVRIIGQLRNSYILLQGEQHVYRVDQHALAERITFEKMRKQVKDEGFLSEILLQPISVSYPKISDIDTILVRINSMGFDVSLFSEGKVIIHAIPHVFAQYGVNIELVMQCVRGIEHKEGKEVKENKVEGKNEDDSGGLFQVLLDEILGMKACKASIKAGQVLSMIEMQQLIQDGISYIDGLFVCQHGRPSVVGTHKHDIDELFDR